MARSAAFPKSPQDRAITAYDSIGSSPDTVLDTENLSRWARIGTWAFGILLLAALIVVVLHFGEIEAFVDLARRSRPEWLFAALLAQVLTYVCAAAVWQRAVFWASSPLSLASLFPLGIAKVFTDQAVPTGGLSGALLVFRSLLQRGIGTETAMAVLLAGYLSYQGAYLSAVLAAFIILAFEGEASVAVGLAVAVFAVVAAGPPAAVLLFRRVAPERAPKLVRRIPGGSALLRIVGGARIEVLEQPRILMETFVLQVAVILLDSATLWLAFRAIGLAPGFMPIFVGFALGSAAATLSPVPLGLGTFEAACTGLLHLQGIPIEPALTATLLLRGFTFWLPMLPGIFLARRELHRTPRTGQRFGTK